MTNLIGTGVYSLGQAARLLMVEERTVNRWMLGYWWRYRGERRFSHPLWKSELSDGRRPVRVVSFRDLLELRLVKAFEENGVVLPVIRATADRAREEFGHPYPLSALRFLTDGRRIFHEQQAQLIDSASRQLVFGEIVKPSLYHSVDYEQDDARRWYPLGAGRKVIVLDPARQFGAPIVSKAGIPTDTLYASYLAEGKDRAAVARIFDVPKPMVDAAVRFEEKLAA